MQQEKDEKKESVNDAIFNLSCEFERLNLAYTEYGFLLSEVRDSGFEHGVLIQYLNDKLEMLVGKMNGLRS